MAGSKRSRREKRRYEAPLNGSVDSLKQLLVEDPLTCYDETPLHVALMLGHLDFAKFVESQTRHGYGSGLAGAFTSSLGCCQWLCIVNVLVSVNPNVCLFREMEEPLSI